MKAITSFAFALALVVGISAVGAQVADAYGGSGDDERGERSHMQGKRMGGNGDNGLVPVEMQQVWRAEHKAECEEMSDEERQELREQHREERQERKAERAAAMEEFTGLTHDELREKRQAGVTMDEVLEEQGIDEDDAREFLIERAEDHAEELVERHDLSDEEAETLRDRIQAFVDNILERWFK